MEYFAMRAIKLKKNISLEFAVLRKVCNEESLLPNKTSSRGIYHSYSYKDGPN